MLGFLLIFILSKKKRKCISEGTPGYLPLRHDSLELSSTSISGNRYANRSFGSLNLLKSNMSIIAANGPPPLYLEQNALPANNNETNDQTTMHQEGGGSFISFKSIFRNYNKPIIW